MSTLSSGKSHLYSLLQGVPNLLSHASTRFKTVCIHNVCCTIVYRAYLSSRKHYHSSGKLSTIPMFCTEETQLPTGTRLCYGDTENSFAPKNPFPTHFPNHAKEGHGKAPRLLQQLQTQEEKVRWTVSLQAMQDKRNLLRHC